MPGTWSIAAAVTFHTDIELAREIQSSLLLRQCQCAATFLEFYINATCPVVDIAVQQLGARMLFVGMPKVGEPV